MKRILFLGAIAVALAACTDRVPTGLSNEAAILEEPDFKSANAATSLRVASVNMYVGAPVEPILAETDPNLIPQRVAEAWAILLATDFPARARAMAAQLAKQRPHLIGLQEVSLFRTQTPSDIVQGNPVPNATDVAFDFLETLLDELNMLGVEYLPVISVENTDVEVPRFDVGSTDPIPFTDVRLTDSDVILVRADVPYANAAAANFSTVLPAPAGINVLRGWTSVDAMVNGTWHRFVNTHLESDFYLVRYGQAVELVTVLAGETKPLIVVGDFNSGPGRELQPDEEDFVAYDLMLQSGYADIWTNPSAPSVRGNTCCHNGTLTNVNPMFSQRIDLIFSKNMTAKNNVRSWLGNDQVGDLRRYGVWSSDHALVFADFVMPNPQN